MAARRRRRGGNETKATFVRERPEFGAHELVELAGKQGIALTPGYIYNIRSQDKKRGVSPRPRGRPSSQPATPARAYGVSVSSSEEQLRSLVIRVGLDRAEEIFAEVKTSVQGFV